MAYYSRIAGTGSYLPPNLLTNRDLEKKVDTNDEWILERTGISSRHIAGPEQATSDLAYEAALQALAAANLAAEDLDAILVGTVTGDQLMPSTACMLQAKLGCRQIMSVDISAACSGFLYCASIADQYIRTGMYKHILVIGAETLSRIVDYEDRGTCILFGDGAGAIILSRTEEGETSQIYTSHLSAAGIYGELLTVQGGGSRIPPSLEMLEKKQQYIQMKGREVFKSAVRAMSDRAQEALESAKISVDEVDWVVAHQANTRIIEAVTTHLQIPQEKQLTNIRETGNTSAASIPILLDESVRSGKVKRGDIVLLVAFGGGFTSGSLLFKY